MAALLLSKFYWFRILMFHDKSPLRTIWAEAGSVLLLVLLIAILFRKRQTAAYTTVNLLLSLFMFASVVYHSYYGKVMTYRAIGQVGQVGEVSDSVTSLIQPVFFILFADAVVYLIVQRWLHARSKGSFAVSRKYMVALFLVCLLASVGKVKAMHADQVLNETRKAEEMGLIMYQISAIFDSRNLPRDVSYERVERLKGENSAQPAAQFGAAKGKNVLIIQMEAFQNFLIGRSVNGQELTPNLNRLIKESYYFPRVFQQIGQGNTSDAEFISNTSLYPTGDAPMSQAYGDREIPSLPRLLKPLGYETMTFHVNDVRFWNRDRLYPALGFDRYYDESFFGKEDVIGLGPSDNVLFRKSLQVLTSLRQQDKPFYAQMVTITGHHPFRLPPERATLSLPPEYAGTLTGDYLQAQHYVDAALGELFADLKRTGLWEDTLIVLYGDHYGLPQQILTDKERQLLSSLVGHTYDTIDIFNIPLIVKVPGVSTGTRIETVGGQLDIMPTVANLLGVPLKGHVHFGRDLLNAKTNLLGERFYLPTGSFINDQVLYIPGDRFEDGTAISLTTHEPVRDLAPFQNDYRAVVELEFTSDAFMRRLPERR